MERSSAAGTSTAGTADASDGSAGFPGAAHSAVRSATAIPAPTATDAPAPAPSPTAGQAGTDLGAAHAWAALGGDPALLGALSFTHRPGLLPARLPVLALARATVAACALSAAELASVRAGTSVPPSLGDAVPAPVPVPMSVPVPAPSVRVDDGALSAAFTSERLLRTDGAAPPLFAPLSRFWRTADGWVRTHANYPHHRARLLSALGIGVPGEDAAAHPTNPGTEEALVTRVAAELATREAAEVEETVYEAGGLAVAIRTPQAWARHPQGAAVARKPLVSSERLDDAPPLPLGAPPPGLPLSGVRVLDLTRVLAGPVATRTFALLGADVLRLDAPQLPESRDTHADTGFGKRSARLDLRSRPDQATFEELLAAAHVVVTGYRPGALDRFGLAPESLAARRPGLVVGQLSAWGSEGPWRRRRGFDSLVQAATGIAVIESGKPEPDGAPERPCTPGVLPAQALDHGTGYLLAAAVLRQLTEQQQGRSGSRAVRLALAQTAAWLTGGLARQATAATQPKPEPEPEPQGTPGPSAAPGVPTAAKAARDTFDASPWLTETSGPLGRLRHAVPPIVYEGGPTAWSRPPGDPGADLPAWQS